MDKEKSALDLTNLSRSIKEFLHKNKWRDINIISINEVRGWFLSRAFVIEYKEMDVEWKIFCRSVKSRNWGYSYDIDRYRCFALSHEMYENSWLEIKSIWILACRNWIITDLWLVWNDIDYFHLQEFYKWEIYSEKFNEIWMKKSLDSNDKKILKNIAEKIGSIHIKQVHDSKNTINIYQRWFQEIIINPEITIDILSCFPNDHWMFWNHDKKYEYMKNMFIEYDKVRQNKTKRKVSYLHGDFWDANILVSEDNNIWLIDYSRIPYWDWWIDIWWFVWNMIIKRILTWNSSYTEAAEYFISEYKAVTWDNDILKYTLLSFFWLWIITLYPPVFWNTKKELWEEIINKIISDFKKWEMTFA